MKLLLIAAFVVVVTTFLTEAHRHSGNRNHRNRSSFRLSRRSSHRPGNHNGNGCLNTCLKSTIIREKFINEVCPDPCEGITCSGRGTCVRGRCNCLPQFTGCDCQNDVVMCTALPQLADATVPAVDVSNAAPGFTVPFTCNRFFQQNGVNGTLTCNNNGNFTPDIACEYCTAFEYDVRSGLTINVETFIREGTSEAECTQMCNADASCQMPVFALDLLGGLCFNLPDSIVGLFIDVLPVLDGTCQTRCTLNQNCLLYSILDASSEGFEFCLLSALSFENRTDVAEDAEEAQSEIGDKVSCV